MQGGTEQYLQFGGITGIDDTLFYLRGAYQQQQNSPCSLDMIIPNKQVQARSNRTVRAAWS